MKREIKMSAWMRLVSNLPDEWERITKLPHKSGVCEPQTYEICAELQRMSLIERRGEKKEIEIKATEHGIKAKHYLLEIKSLLLQVKNEN